MAEFKIKRPRITSGSTSGNPLDAGFGAAAQRTIQDITQGQSMDSATPGMRNSNINPSAMQGLRDSLGISMGIPFTAMSGVDKDGNEQNLRAQAMAPLDKFQFGASRPPDTNVPFPDLFKPQDLDRGEVQPSYQPQFSYNVLLTASKYPEANGVQERVAEIISTVFPVFMVLNDSWPVEKRTTLSHQTQSDLCDQGIMFTNVCTMNYNLRYRDTDRKLHSMKNARAVARDVKPAIYLNFVDNTRTMATHSSLVGRLMAEFMLFGWTYKPVVNLWVTCQGDTIANNSAWLLLEKMRPNHHDIDFERMYNGQKVDLTHTDPNNASDKDDKGNPIKPIMQMVPYVTIGRASVPHRLYETQDFCGERYHIGKFGRYHKLPEKAKSVYTTVIRQLMFPTEACKPASPEWAKLIKHAPTTDMYATCNQF